MKLYAAIYRHMDSFEEPYGHHIHQAMCFKYNIFVLSFYTSAPADAKQISCSPFRESMNTFAVKSD